MHFGDLDLLAGNQRLGADRAPDAVVDFHRADAVGERRESSVHYTSFQRENPTRPSHLVEMRYNDREGLLALGIPVDDARPSPNDP